MIDFETCRAGIKAAVNNWGIWINDMTFDGNLLSYWGEEKLTYEVYVMLYWGNLPPRHQKALRKRILGEPCTVYWNQEASRAITDITHFMTGRKTSKKFDRFTSGQSYNNYGGD